MDVSALEQDSLKFAGSAVECDQRGHIAEAIFYYKVAVEALVNAASAGSKLNCFEKANEYQHRIEQLNKLQTQKTQPVKTKAFENAERAKIILLDALNEDEQGNEEEAIDLYLQAADLCIKSRSATDISNTLRKQLESMAKQSLDRAENLKTKKSFTSLAELDHILDFSKSSVQKSTKNDKKSLPASNSKNTDSSNANVKHTAVDFNDTQPSLSSSVSSINKEPYTKEELDVLRFTSLINGREYVPFMSADLKERFSFPVPFSDKNGFLELSTKQKSRLGAWKRPDQFMSDPKMIMAVSSLNIKQTVVSDCSFIASLAISASYERKFKKKLITRIIYPQNRKREPVYNPCGKYMVKLHINGVPRKVVIDDFLPVDKYGSLLCSYSANENELWVSLVEKAYMKVMGGYDFPGSNSNIDLHALTGWIPERQSLREKNFDYNKFFDMLQTNFHRGRCLATISTGPMSESDADRAGLVPTHAYAILDVKQVNKIKLLQLKNPWSHLRWKGKYSANDEKNWTPVMKQALNYDNKFAQQYDNGVFWIDWESAMHFYDTVYISWDPGMFSKTMSRHASWLAKDGPEKDSVTLGNNPQYRLEVRNKKSAVVWVLLTRHITEKDDFAENKEFITLLVYKTEGKKVYYTYSPPPFMDGVRINSPHYLSKINVKEGGERFTLVVSQYEKHKNIRYTLRVYSIADFKFQKIADIYQSKKKLTGEWNKTNAGGCANNRDTYGTNPIYQVHLPGAEKGQFLMELRAPREYSVGMDIVCVETNSDEAFSKKTTGAYRSGYTMIELTLPPGVYNIVPSTFSPQQLGPFILLIASNLSTFKVSKLK